MKIKSEKSLVNPTNEFHILRHFKYVNESYKKTLIGQPYWYYDYNQNRYVSSKISQIDIENALKTIGTKFEKNISGIETPKKLLKVIKNKFEELLSNKKISWIDNQEYKTVTFKFDYQFFVGQMNCLNQDLILEKDKVRIKSALRSKCAGENTVVINTISDIKTSSTKSIYVEIIKARQPSFDTVTAFPDCLLPDDIPNEKLVFVV